MPILQRSIAPAIYLACLAVFAGCNKQEGAGAKAAAAAQPGSGKGKDATKAFDVRTTTVTTRKVTYEVEAVGSLVEENRFDIPARLAGVAQHVNFAEGDSVTTGAELCRIDYDRFNLQVKQAESELSEKEAAAQRALASVADVERSTSAALETARVNLDLAQSEFKRRADRGANAFTSPEERDQFEAKFRQAQTAYRDAVNAASTQVALAAAQAREAQAAYNTAQAMLALAKDNLQRSIVKSPMAGVIQKRNVVEGQFVDQGDTVALMVQSDPLRLRFTVPESRVSRLSKNMNLTFTVPAYANRHFGGSVYDIGAFADPDTREIICWAHVDNHEASLKPGFFAHVDLKVDSKSDAIVVPLTAVLPSEMGMTAYVVQDGQAHRRVVKTGLNVTGDAVEILEGLEAGEQLVVEGMNALQDGVPVKVLPPVGPIMKLSDEVVSSSSKTRAGEKHSEKVAAQASPKTNTVGQGG